MSDRGSFSPKELAFYDIEREMRVTRKVLEAVPEEKFAWKPHEKSMTLQRMAHHVAQMPEWITMTLGMDEMDFASVPMPKPPENKAELLTQFDKAVAQMRQVIAGFDMARMNGTWTIRQGPEIITARPRIECFRMWCMNHLIHHRGQLCMFLRLLNVPVPAVYFNSADFPEMVFE